MSETEKRTPPAPPTAPPARAPYEAPHLEMIELRPGEQLLACLLHPVPGPCEPFFVGS